MSDPLSVPVSDVIDKILQINTLAPRCAGDSMTYRFMRYMASSESTYLRHSETLYPEIFLMTFATALTDAEKGVNSFTGVRVPRTIANMSPIMYSLIRRDLPIIADAIFPSEFAADVKQLYTSVMDELSSLVAAPAPQKKRASKRR